MPFREEVIHYVPVKEVDSKRELRYESHGTESDFCY
jgi:hypothetical protein